MRWLRLAAPAIALAAMFAISFAQQEPPAGAPREGARPPADSPPAESPPAAPPEEAEPESPRADGEEVDDVFVPTEELQPDAAVTFPVDI